MAIGEILAIGIPAAAMLAGASIGLWWVPGIKLRSASQHLAAGIIFAAVATELVPSMVQRTNPLAIAGSAG